MKISGQKVIGLKEYKVSSNLLWADSDRNMNGDMRATYLGEYPKIELEFRDGLTRAQVSQIYSQLSSPFFNITYYHPGTDNTVTAQYYRSDFTIGVLDKSRGLFNSFSVNLIPISRRA